jgi:hypothetical protein
MYVVKLKEMEKELGQRKKLVARLGGSTRTIQGYMNTPGKRGHNIADDAHVH